MIKMLSVADVITIINAVFGFLAIILVFSSQFEFAASFILLGLLADGLDGIVARRIGNGHMGEYLETIADVISLSVAPLALLYMVYFETIALSFFSHVLFVIILIFSFFCSVIRLSSFSAMKHTEIFIGLPTSANAIFLVLASFLRLELLFILPFIVLFALLMISPLRFPKHGLTIDILAGLFILGAIFLNFFYMMSAGLLLLFGLLLYIIIGPLYVRIKKKNG
jgi:CDP-diacylglycerol--serine O-phosphatidyltransferase